MKNYDDLNIEINKLAKVYRDAGRDILDRELTTVREDALYRQIQKLNFDFADQLYRLSAECRLIDNLQKTRFEKIADLVKRYRKTVA